MKYSNTVPFWANTNKCECVWAAGCKQGKQLQSAELSVEQALCLTLFGPHIPIFASLLFLPFPRVQTEAEVAFVPLMMRMWNNSLDAFCLCLFVDFQLPRNTFNPHLRHC